MTEMQKKILAHMIAKFDQTYKKFLEKAKLPDLPVVRIGFYAVARQMVSEDPYPDLSVHEAVVVYLSTIEAEALNDMYDEISDMFVSATKKFAST